MSGEINCTGSILIGDILLNESLLFIVSNAHLYHNGNDLRMIYKNLKGLLQILQYFIGTVGRNIIAGKCLLFVVNARHVKKLT